MEENRWLLWMNMQQCLLIRLQLMLEMKNKQLQNPLRPLTASHSTTLLCIPITAKKSWRLDLSVWIYLSIHIPLHLFPWYAEVYDERSFTEAKRKVSFTEQQRYLKPWPQQQHKLLPQAVPSAASLLFERSLSLLSHLHPQELHANHKDM